jgi:chromosome partitioning protein
VPTSFLLFAEAIASPNGAPPTWTDKEVLLAVLGLLGAGIPVVWGIVKFLTINVSRKLRESEDRVKELTTEVDQLKAGYIPQIVDLNLRLENATQELAQVRKEADGYRQVSEAFRGERDVLLRERDEALTGRDAARDELNAKLVRIRKAANKDGAIWAERVLASATAFRPLDPESRPTPILSVLNLKGGVGKTTATAHLAAAFAYKGYRVLLLDLDLQGSLTGQFLNAATQKEAFDADKSVAKFLEAAFESEAPAVKDFAVPVNLPTKSMIVPTMDDLAYEEMNLTVRWFLKDGNKDPRFLLRKRLQLKQVTNEFDVILLDCPPLLNMSCVNALAASDYVIVPTIASKQSTERVHNLMQFVKELREDVNPHLGVMGFFANRTKQSNLTAGERDMMTGLEQKCLDALGHPVPCFASHVPQSTDVRVAEETGVTFGPGDKLYEHFEALAGEIEDRLPTFCKVNGQPATAAIPEGVTT